MVTLITRHVHLNRPIANGGSTYYYSLLLLPAFTIFFPHTFTIFTLTRSNSGANLKQLQRQKIPWKTKNLKINKLQIGSNHMLYIVDTLGINFE